MQAKLNVTLKVLAYSDPQVSNNPRLRSVDWLRDISGQDVNNPKSEAFSIPCGGSVTVFDGTRALSTGPSSAFDLSLLSVDAASRYRLAWTGGTNPVFRTGRSLAMSGVQLTFTVASNGTVTVVANSVVFGAVQTGDEVFVPHTTTGDAANAIDVINAGYWVVLSKTDNSTLVLVRPSGQDFEAVSETVTLTSNGQFVAYSAAGVQVGDSVDITAGFSISAQRTFEILAVTDTFIEFVSTTPIPDESGITPGASGLSIYYSSKVFLYVESTQEIVVRANGDTGNTQRVSAFDSSDAQKPGIYMRRGPTWALTLVNRSATAAEVIVIHAES